MHTRYVIGLLLLWFYIPRNHSKEKAKRLSGTPAPRIIPSRRLHRACFNTVRFGHPTGKVDGVGDSQRHNYYPTGRRMRDWWDAKVHIGGYTACMPQHDKDEEEHLVAPFRRRCGGGGGIGVTFSVSLLVDPADSSPPNPGSQQE